MEETLLELILREEDELSGVEAISLVETPATEEDWIFLSEHKVELAVADTEKRILMGAALVPNKKIKRAPKEEGGKPFFIFFSENTVRQISQKFLKSGKQNNTTLAHQIPLNNVSIVESWIIEDDVHDKSRKFGLTAPVGTWMLSVKVEDDTVWNEWVKEGRIKGFSIEGKFADELHIQAESEDKAVKTLELILNILTT